MELHLASYLSHFKMPRGYYTSEKDGVIIPKLSHGFHLLVDLKKVIIQEYFLRDILESNLKTNYEYIGTCTVMK